MENLLSLINVLKMNNKNEEIVKAPVITKKNAVDFSRLITDVIEESDEDDKNS